MSRLILAAGVLGLPLLVAAQPPTPSQTLDRVGVEQRIGERVPLDLRFTDRHGDSVPLGNLIDGKPALLQLAWYDCPNLCDLSLRRRSSRPTTSASTRAVIRQARFSSRRMSRV